jgi:hypothetical protein
MATQKRLSWAAIYRHASGRRARRLYIALFLLIVAFSGLLRVRSFLLTRKIQAVVSGLQQLHVDVSAEEEVQRTVPYLVRETEQQTPSGVIRTYGVQLSNVEDREWIPGYRQLSWPVSAYRSDPAGWSKWRFLSLPLGIAYALGWRHISFEASVTVLNGVVSGVQYDIEPDVLTREPPPYLVLVRSVHGVWGGGLDLLVPVSDVDDESPEYLFGEAAGAYFLLEGADTSIALAYTADAPRAVVSDAFDVDLSCFWGIRGCASARQVTPLLWKDRQAVIGAAAARLGSQNPCPDRILAGRVRRLLDVVVELREVTEPSLAGAKNELEPAASPGPGYRLIERIRGRAETAPRFSRHWTPESYPLGFVFRRDPVAPSLKAGDKVLVFLGGDFQSCRTVPSTASAESAVRTAVPASKRSEDDIMRLMSRQ